MATQTEIQYNRKLQQIVKLVKADVDAEIVPAIKQSVPEYVADAWFSVWTESMSLLRANLKVLLKSLPQF